MTNAPITFIHVKRKIQMEWISDFYISLHTPGKCSDSKAELSRVLYCIVFSF